MCFHRHLVKFYFLSQALYYITVTQTLANQHLVLVARAFVPAYFAAKATPSLVRFLNMTSSGPKV